MKTYKKINDFTIEVSTPMEPKKERFTKDYLVHIRAAVSLEESQGVIEREAVITRLQEELEIYKQDKAKELLNFDKVIIEADKVNLIEEPIEEPELPVEKPIELPEEEPIIK